MKYRLYISLGMDTLFQHHSFTSIRQHSIEDSCSSFGTRNYLIKIGVSFMVTQCFHLHNLSMTQNSCQYIVEIMRQPSRHSTETIHPNISLVNSILLTFHNQGLAFARTNDCKRIACLPRDDSRLQDMGRPCTRSRSIG